MSKAGTRRTTILNRRAAWRVALVYWGKRIGLVGLVALLLGGWGHYATNSGYVDQMMGRVARFVHAQWVDMGFQVNHVALVGRVNADKNTLKTIVDIDKGQSIFAVDLQELQTRLQSVTWVKSAVVERRLPDSVVVTLHEHTPLAMWQNKGKLYVIDSEGVVLEDPQIDRFKDLLIIVGDEAPVRARDLVAMINAEKNLKERVESAKWVGGRRWDLYLKNGVTIKLPEDDMGQALRRLSDAQAEAGLMDKKVKAIDVRDPVRIVVQTDIGAAEDYKASFKPEKNI